MKLLLDQNLSYRLAKKLRPVFDHCVHVSDVSLHDCEDQDIFQFAKKEGYSIVTFDSDFYELAILQGNIPKIIWLRGSNQHSGNILAALISHKTRIEQFIMTEGQGSKVCLEVWI